MPDLSSELLCGYRLTQRAPILSPDLYYVIVVVDNSLRLYTPNGSLSHILTPNESSILSAVFLPDTVSQVLTLHENGLAVISDIDAEATVSSVALTGTPATLTPISGGRAIATTCATCPTDATKFIIRAYLISKVDDEACATLFATLQTVSAPAAAAALAHPSGRPVLALTIQRTLIVVDTDGTAPAVFAAPTVGPIVGTSAPNGIAIALSTGEILVGQLPLDGAAACPPGLPATNTEVEGQTEGVWKVYAPPTLLRQGAPLITSPGTTSWAHLAWHCTCPGFLACAGDTLYSGGREGVLCSWDTTPAGLASAQAKVYPRIGGPLLHGAVLRPGDLGRTALLARARAAGAGAGARARAAVKLHTSAAACVALSIDTNRVMILNTATSRSDRDIRSIPFAGTRSFAAPAPAAPCSCHYSPGLKAIITPGIPGQLDFHTLTDAHLGTAEVLPREAVSTAPNETTPARAAVVAVGVGRGVIATIDGNEWSDSELACTSGSTGLRQSSVLRIYAQNQAPATRTSIQLARAGPQATHNLVVECAGAVGYPRILSVAPNGSAVAVVSGGARGGVAVWAEGAAAGWAPSRLLVLQGLKPVALAFSDDSSIIAVGYSTGDVGLWSAGPDASLLAAIPAPAAIPATATAPCKLAGVAFVGSDHLVVVYSSVEVTITLVHLPTLSTLSTTSVAGAGARVAGGATVAAVAVIDDHGLITSFASVDVQNGVQFHSTHNLPPYTRVCDALVVNSCPGAVLRGQTLGTTVWLPEGAQKAVQHDENKDETEISKPTLSAASILGGSVDKMGLRTGVTRGGVTTTIGQHALLPEFDAAIEEIGSLASVYDKLID